MPTAASWTQGLPAGRTRVLPVWAAPHTAAKGSGPDVGVPGLGVCRMARCSGPGRKHVDVLFWWFFRSNTLVWFESNYFSESDEASLTMPDLPNLLSTAFAVGADQPRSRGHPAGCRAPACALAAARAPRAPHTAARIREEGGQCHLQSHCYQFYCSEPV